MALTYAMVVNGVVAPGGQMKGDGSAENGENKIFRRMTRNTDALDV